MFVFAVGSEVTPMFDFVSFCCSPPSVTLSGRQYTPPPAPVSMCWSLSLSLRTVCGRWVTEGDRERLRDPKVSTDLRREVRETGKSGRQRGNSRKRSSGRRQFLVPALLDSWCRVVEGEGVDFRGRGGWGRPRGTCWLTPEVSECLQRGSGKRSVNAAASPLSVQPLGNGYKLRHCSFIYQTPRAVWMKIFLKTANHGFWLWLSFQLLLALFS